MKLHTASFFGIIAVLTSIMFISSCSRNEPVAGAWIGNPVRINVPDAADATATITLDFSPVDKASGIGNIVMSATIDVAQAVTTTEASINQPYQTNVAATAWINGTYSYEDGDDDEIVLNLNPSSLNVTIDPSGVAFSENMLTEAQTPVVDSLTTATVNSWRVILTGAMREEFYRYQKIDDIKVHHTDMMSCEVADHDYTFRRAN